MKAITYTKYGGPGNLKLSEVPRPKPKEKEVLVKVHAASINSWDWDLLTGTFQGRLGAFRRPRHKILGCDIAGKVVAVGKNVKHFKVGDEVFGDTSGFRERDFGGFAEYTVAREDILAMKPRGMTFVQAAAIPQTGLLALQGLRMGHIKNGQKVLINGAGGGGGTFAIQIAKTYGVELTGVDSKEKFGIMKKLGCDHVIDYKKEDFTKNGKKYDLILDVKTNRSVFRYRRSLNPNGLYITVGGSTGRILQLVLFKPLNWSNRKLKILGHKANRKDLKFMTKLFEEGKVKPIIDKVFSLKETPEAFKYFGSGRFKGKIVIKIK